MEGLTYYYDYSNNSNSALCDPESVISFSKVFIPVLYSLVFIIGLVGNGLVLCVLLKHCRRSNLTDLCLMNLSVSDLLFLLTLPLFAHHSAVSLWSFGDFMCHITAGLHKLGYHSSTLFMVLMTLDRYVLIQHPQKAAKYRSVKAAMLLSMCVWVLSLAVSLPAFVFTREANTSEHFYCDHQDKMWLEYDIFATNILGFLLPVTGMVGCYSRIIPTLMKIRSAKKHRIIKLIVCIIIVFFLFWAPYNITLFIDFLRLEGVLTDSCELDTNLRVAIVVTETIAFSHCCLNPIIYAFAGEKFLKRSRFMLRRMLSGVPFLSGVEMSDSSFRLSSGVSRPTVTTV